MQICLFYIARESNDTCNQARKIVRVEASDSKPSLRSIARFKNDSSRFLHTILHNMYFMRSLNRVIYTSTSRIKTIMIFVQDTFITVIVSNIYYYPPCRSENNSIFVSHAPKILITTNF